MRDYASKKHVFFQTPSARRPGALPEDSSKEASSRSSPGSDLSAGGPRDRTGSNFKAGSSAGNESGQSPVILRQRRRKSVTSSFDTVPGGWAVAPQSKSPESPHADTLTPASSFASSCSVNTLQSMGFGSVSTGIAPLSMGFASPSCRKASHLALPCPSVQSRASNGFQNSSPIESIDAWSALLQTSYSNQNSSQRLHSLKRASPVRVTRLSNASSSFSSESKTGSGVERSDSAKSGTDSIPSPRTTIRQRRALVVGIGYSLANGTASLKSAAKSTAIILQLLCGTLGVAPENIWLLTDESVEAMAGCRRFQPSKANIINGMKWLVRGSIPGDALYFYFTGVGGQEKDRSGDALGGWDDTLLPVDFKETGHIVDDDLHKILVRRLPSKVQLTAIVDAVNTATVMDLPFSQCSKGTKLGQLIGSEYEAKLRSQMANAEQNPEARHSKKSLHSLLGSRSKKSHSKILENNKLILQHADGLQQKTAEEIKRNGQIVSYSYVTDRRPTRNDLFSAGPGGVCQTGLLTKAFVGAVQQSLRTSNTSTHSAIFAAMEDTIKRGASAQIVPQMSYSHEVAPSSKFLTK